MDDGMMGGEGMGMEDLSDGEESDQDKENDELDKNNTKEKKKK